MTVPASERARAIKGAFGVVGMCGQLARTTWVDVAIVLRTSPQSNLEQDRGPTSTEALGCQRLVTSVWLL